MNLTPRQKDLLFAVVDGHRFSGCSDFIFVQHHSRGGLCFAGGPFIPLNASETDFRQLDTEKLITLVPGPGLTGQPTQLGIETAASLRREAAPSTAATSNEAGVGGRRPMPAVEAKLDSPLGNNPFPINHPCHQLWIDMMANTPQSRGSVLTDSLVQNRNPFPEGTRDYRIWKEVHEIWTDTGLWAKEHLALFHSEILESMPPEEASEKEFFDHLLKAEGGTFDIWAGAFSRHAVLTDDAAGAFEHLLAEVEKVMIAQASRYPASFLPERLFSSELRNRLNQRKQYWTGQMLRRVREHKEASRANAEAGSVVRTEQGAVDTAPPVEPPNASAEAWHIKLRAARKKAKLSRPGAAKSLKKIGIQITADAIKKHEEGAAMPRPDVRKGYAAIYGVPENEIFPPAD